jgi:replicative DNA helicase
MVNSAKVVSFSGDRDLLPPHNIDVEEVILGGILLDPVAIERVQDILLPEAFYISAHQEIFRAALSLNNQGKNPDIMQVATWLHDHGLLEKIGGQARLADLMGSVVSAVNIDQYAALLMDKYTRRRLIEVSHEIQSIAYDGTQPVEQILDLSEQKLYAVNQSLNTAQLSATPVGEICDELYIDLEAGFYPGLTTGHLDFDALTGGYFPGELTVAAGATSMGKSHYGTALSYAIAARHRLPTVIFTCEMPKKQYTERLLAHVTLVNSMKIRFRQIPQDDRATWEKILQGSNHLAEQPIYIYDCSNPSYTQMRSILRRVPAPNGIGLVVLDYLQLLQGQEDKENRARELNRITWGCKQIAMEFNTSFLALSQIRRDVSTRANKRPTLDDLYESGAIANHSDRVMFFYRDDYYNPDSSDRGIIELIVAKVRAGATGTCKMLFDPTTSRFLNVKTYG